ncbi:MAG: glycoside hydrolase family 2 protein [Chloroflexi bacterium]|nr:glycoside hydrolase family 2 protein [Chloroflexota bacterium]
MLRRYLHTGWSLRQHTGERHVAADLDQPSDWIPAQVPGTVHQDLIAARVIPDPFVGRNEDLVQWVGEADWVYRASFEVSPTELSSEFVDLVFQGLDTFTTVWLNGYQILQSDNMFLPYRVDVRTILREGTNELRMLFESALRRGKEREAAHGRLTAWNGDASRLYVRKAQYHYGWDWGPCLLTAGPWGPISLEAYTTRLESVRADAQPTDDEADGTLDIAVDVAGETSGQELVATVAVTAPSGERVLVERCLLSEGVVKARLRLQQVQLWWPRGLGDQSLYTVEVRLSRDSELLDVYALRVGFRRLRLIQEPLDNGGGRSFLFECNGVPLFCGGANWIPADSFLPRITPEVYRRWLDLAVGANVTMLRVWGGGIYEADAFYGCCDELGVLVWQDFTFACGLYPSLPWFIESVRQEAQSVVHRLRHHPSLALWCGNNEDHMLVDSLRAHRLPRRQSPEEQLFPAQVIYEEVLPKVCEELDGTRPYWPGSPFGGTPSNSGSVGDRHVWDVWHGAMAPYQHYPKFEGRFVSEFGMQAFPVPETVAAFAEEAERHAHGRTIEHHNKAADGSRRLAVYLSDVVRVPATFDDYVFATQVVQSEALRAAIRGWRARWEGPHAYAVAGALVWQLNDCWPVISWSLVDSLLCPKPAYYTVRRSLAARLVTLLRAGSLVHIWICNASYEEIIGRVELSAWTLDGQRLRTQEIPVAVGPNRSNRVGEIDDIAGGVWGARLLVDDAVVARDSAWPEPLKYQQLIDPGVTLRAQGGTVELTVGRPAKAVWVMADPEVRWSDNMLDIFPGDPQVLTLESTPNSPVRVRWLHW